jgi:hypothetical protein
MPQIYSGAFFGFVIENISGTNFLLKTQTQEFDIKKPNIPEL